MTHIEPTVEYEVRIGSYFSQSYKVLSDAMDRYDVYNKNKYCHPCKIVKVTKTYEVIASKGDKNDQAN